MSDSMLSRDVVVAEARKRYTKAISLDRLDDALQEASVEDAVNMLLMDSCMWDSPSGNAFDTDHVIDVPFADEHR